MVEAPRETFVERTLSNLAGVWRDIASSAARSLGRSNGRRSPRDADALRGLMAECLQARGGEVTARMRAADLGRTYIELEAPGRELFLDLLAADFGTDPQAISRAIETYRAAGDPETRLAAEAGLRDALVPPRMKLLTQFNTLPEGVKFLVDLRADLLQIAGADPYRRSLERDLRELLESWFDIGFLDLRRITWDSPASLLEKLIAYEAVHEIRSWDDLRNRLDSDRRLYALFHPRMPDEPLAFVEVALVRGLTAAIQALLDEAAPPGDPDSIDSAIFYSITNTQEGLRGISFGDFLIKRVVQQLAREMPQLKTFATLSPMPGLRAWLDRAPAKLIASLMTEEERGGVRALGGSDEPKAALLAVLDRPGWPDDPVVANALRALMLRVGARYLLEVGETGEPHDPVMRFHLKNGAQLERINWLGDSSAKGLRQSASLMVNYRYILDDIEKNHEAYIREGRIAMSGEIRALAKTVTETEGSPLRRLGLLRTG